ncbi:hypothetical protein B0H16DRAFT_1632615 [Mycena metata]|uniref:F-box domain-containing protein n=1 Tax=Mycena metata TaxID=1033252 RepID=A0AAD7GZK3_9AGAR|nr:hypothetical protein B0H16DRAFT_1632615 [Mycena metata]
MHELISPDAELEAISAVFYNTPDPYGMLLCRRRELEQVVAGNLSAASRLPPELLSEIFLQFTPARLPPKADDPHLVLPLVCRAWRSLVSESPELWANISIGFEEGAAVQRAIRIAEQWISRAGPTHPLEITAACVGAYAHTVHDNPELVSGFMEFVLSRAHRLKNADLSFPFATLHSVFNLPSGSFPLLEGITLQPLLSLDDFAPPDTDAFAPWHWPSDSKAFHSAPLIREISYSPRPLFTSDVLGLVGAAAEGMMNDTQTQSVVWDQHVTFAASFSESLPWAQLTAVEFSLTALTVDVWCSIFNECPRIKNLHVAIRSSPHNINPAEPISLRWLETLVLSNFSGGAEAMLDHLLTPKLTTFGVLGQSIPLFQIISFQTRSRFELQNLIVAFPINVTEFIPFLEQFPTIKQLEIYSTPTDRFPSSFWDRIRTGKLFPALTGLVLRPSLQSLPPLVDIIEAKWENTEVWVLFVVWFTGGNASLEEVTEELQRLDKYDPDEFKRRVAVTVLFGPD